MEPSPQATAESDDGSAKSRLFGEASSDRLRKKLAMAQFMAGLDLPSEGDSTSEGLDGATEPTADHYPAEPVRIGRFTVLRKLGQGGMGVVYAAYDEELDRKIALKLMRSELSKDERGRARMLREAKALARLSHPNVVHLHEIGEWQGHDFLAMEFIDGQTLRAWLRTEDREWEEVLRVMVATGRGLAAAHDAGLVHRDFKPANVLVDEDYGRPRVLDFGLARQAGQGPSYPVSELIETGEHSVSGAPDSQEASFGEATRSGSAVFDQLLTVSGAVIGTPAYMAPEQHLAQRATELSDQFSFCLVLYEALYGERPYASKTRQGYANAVICGQLSPAPAGARVPGWLRDVVCRGLATKPEERWPSMHALLAELARDRVQRWRRVGVAASMCAIVGAAISFGAASGEAGHCVIDSSVVEDSWGSEQRAALEQAFAATGLTAANDLLTHVTHSYDSYAEALVEGQRSACTARWTENRQTDAQLELRMACLEQRERELRANVEALSRIDASSLSRSSAVLRRLGDIEMCAAIEELERGVPVPKDPRTAAGIADAREDIARADAARTLGHIDDAKLITADLRARAEVFAYAPLSGEVALLAGANAWEMREIEQAREATLEAIAVATRTGDAELGTEASLQLAGIYASEMQDPSDALVFAEAYASRTGNRPAHRFRLHHTRGHILHTAGKYAQSLAELDLAVGLAETGFPGSEYEYMSALLPRSVTLSELGRAEEAMEDLRQIIALGSRTGDHPLVAKALFNLGITHLENSQFDEGEALVNEAKAAYERIHGPRYPFIGHAELALAQLAFVRGQPELARPHIEAALRLFEADPDATEDMAYALDAAAEMALSDGDHARALELLERGAAVYAGNPDASNRRADFLARKGEVLLAAERYAEGLVELDAALAAIHADADSLARVSPLVLRAKVLRQLGQSERARVDLEHVIELTPMDCGRALKAAEARVELGELLAESDTQLSPQLLREALDFLESQPEDHWLVARARDLSHD